MQFAPPRRKNAPSVIIISLIDVLIVVLIFLIVTTTVRQQPAVKLSLPESKQQKTGATDSDTLEITIPKEGVPLYLRKNPVTLDQLQSALIDAAKQNPKLSVFIDADTQAPFGQIIKVMDVTKAAHITSVSAKTTHPK
jgi:biopolymer transport protein ExbD